MMTKVIPRLGSGKTSQRPWLSWELKDGKESVTGGRRNGILLEGMCTKAWCLKSRVMLAGCQTGHGREKEEQCSQVTGDFWQRVLWYEQGCWDAGDSGPAPKPSGWEEEAKPPNSALIICGRRQWAPELIVCVEQDSWGEESLIGEMQKQDLFFA